MNVPQSPHVAANGRFRNPWPGQRVGGFGSLLWWMLQRARRGRIGFGARGNPPVPLVPARPQERAPADQFRITWIGHSSFLLQVGGLNVLTDPMFGERASPVTWAGPRRLNPPGLALDDLPPVDLVLISHDHYDHLDARSIRRLAERHPTAVWCAPLGVSRHLRSRGARTVLEFDWFDTARPFAAAPHLGVEIACVPARHFSGRHALDRNATLWCGWTIAAGSFRAYFVGDTGYHPGFAEIGRRCGPFDVIFMPVGAYDPRWFMRPVHLDPEEAVAAFTDVTASGPTNAPPSVMVAMHWGTFVLTDEPIDEPPRRARNAWSVRGLTDDRLWAMVPGETRVLQR